jgi:hypothetical protein
LSRGRDEGSHRNDRFAVPRGLHRRGADEPTILSGAKAISVKSHTISLVLSPAFGVTPAVT